MILVIIILYIIYFWCINLFSGTAFIDITKNMPDDNDARSELDPIMD